MKLKVYRYDPDVDEKSRFDSYTIKTKEKGMKVLGALTYINEEYGANIAFRSSCRTGQCGSCAVVMNGRPGLACRTVAKDGMVIEPLKNTSLIKDLVVDIKPIYDRIKTLRPYLHRGSATQKEGKIDRISLKKTIFRELKDCIECFSCLSGCPVKESDPDYAGPSLMRLISRFELDPRDKLGRFPIALSEGIYKCTTCGKCSVVCPEGFRIHEDVIENMRERIYKRSRK